MRKGNRSVRVSLVGIMEEALEGDVLELYTYRYK
jgi:hypothetical protein